MPHSCAVRRPLARLAAGAAVLTGILAVLVTAARPAAAQVTAGGGPAGPGATRVTFTVERGCAGSPTTSLVIRLPEGTTDVVPEAKDGWTVEVSDGDLAWTGGRVPDGTATTFAAAMRIPGMAGDVVFLPAMQVCAVGELAWTVPSADPRAAGAAPRVELVVSYLPRKAAPDTGAPAATAPVAEGSVVPAPVSVAAGSRSSAVASVLGAAGVVTLMAVVVVGILVARRATGGDT